MGYGRLAVVVGTLGAIAGVVGCPQTGSIDFCDYPDLNHVDKDGTPDECHCDDDAGVVGIRSPGYCEAFLKGKDAGTDGDAEGPIPSCSGQCVALQPLGWSAPSLLWVGADLDAPPCPDVAPVVGYEGHADLSAPLTCGACNCDPPAGTCELPATVTVHAATCAHITPTTPETPFDPPPTWDGVCDTEDSVASGKLCAGSPCVQSITIAPPTVGAEACAPVALPIPAKVAATWKTHARACIGTTIGGCADHDQTCAAVPEALPDGLRMCIFHEGDMACPSGSAYTDKHVFYGSITDTRDCSPCTCGAPSGSTCAALISLYTDGACSNLLLAEQVDSTKPTCADVIAGAALGSKSAGPAVYAPGTCEAAGGEAMGMAEPSDPVTFCCAG